MLLIQHISSDPLQKLTLVLPDGTQLGMTLYYRSMQQGWFIQELTYNDFVVTGLRICNQPDLLYQWKNKLPFGLACFTTASREPSFQDDFSSGASKLYILTNEEKLALQAYYEAGITT